jgi:Peptidase family M28
MVRGTWLLVGLPLLVAAFTVTRPAALPAPGLPPTFDGAAAAALTDELARRYPDRTPGSTSADAAARWVVNRFRSYGFATESQRFSAEIPGRGRVELRNLVAKAVGRSPEVIAVVAHRDDAGRAAGVNDNASGTAALIELARPYAQASGSRSLVPVRPAHTIVFLSTDGGASGGLGAAYFAADPAYRERLLAVVVLDSIAGAGAPRLQLAGDEPRSPPAELVQTAAERLREQTGDEPGRPGALRQLVDLGFPFSLYEQAPFVARGVPAVTLTTAGDRPPPSVADTADPRADRLQEIGRAAQGLVSSLDQGLELETGAGAYVYLGPRVVRGWAIQLVLVAALLPFLAGAVDLFARCRRHRIQLAPALRSYRSRLGIWLFAGAAFFALGALGAWPDGEARPLSPESAVAGDWPIAALLVLALIGLAGWFVGRERLLPRRPVASEEALAGYTATLLVLGVIALVVVAMNAYALIFLLPSLHAWLWLPQVRDRSVWLRLGVLVLGFAGPLLLLGSFAFRFGLGLDAPWYLAALVALGYVTVPAVLVAVAWLAAAAQLTALVGGRYAPYPSIEERPPRGPLRALVGRAAAAWGARRRAPEPEPGALEA